MRQWTTVTLVCAQVGATPGGTGAPRFLIDGEMQAAAASLPEGQRPTMPTGPDPKWRFFWRVGERPTDGQFAELNADPVVPVGEVEATPPLPLTLTLFSEWIPRMGESDGLLGLEDGPSCRGCGTDGSGWPGVGTNRHYRSYDQGRSRLYCTDA